MFFFLFQKWENAICRLWQSKGGNVEQILSSLTLLTSASTGPCTQLGVAGPAQPLGDLPCSNPALSCRKFESLPFDCSQRKISGQSSTFLRSHNPVAPRGGDELHCLVLLPCEKGGA